MQHERSTTTADALAGVWQLSGSTYTRESDGYVLARCHRTHVRRGQSTVFFVDATVQARPYVSSIWPRPDGDEFELAGTRYKMRWVSETRVEFYVISRRYGGSRPPVQSTPPPPRPSTSSQSVCNEA